MESLTPQAKALWGKKKIVDGEEQWLPLIAHLIDTKNVIDWLYTNWISEGTRNTLCQNMAGVEMQKLVKFLGFFHDLGKAVPAFQYKPSYYNSHDLDEDLNEKLKRSGLNSVDLTSNDIRYSPHPLAGEAILERLGLNKFVGALIGGHHGAPPSDDRIVHQQLSAYTFNLFGSDQDQKIKKEWESVQKNLIDYGLKKCGYKNLNEIPEITRPQAVILEGLIIMADWLASSETLNDESDVELFNLISIDDDFDDLDMKQRFKNAISNWVVNDQWVPESMMSVTKLFKQRFNFSPRPLQEKMTNSIIQAQDPGMIIVECAPGSGKTETALAAAEQLAAKTGKNGLYFGLPTQATTNAMFSRVDSWLEKQAVEQRTNLDIKLQQGKAKFNKEYRDLPYAENVSDSGAVVVNNWFTGKKASLAHFTIGTIDNLLLMGLKQKHLFLRHLGFSDKIVIIDEIHAYDVYMSSYLKKTLMWLGAYHVPVIALSATLPKEKRSELLAAYAKGKFGRVKLVGDDGWENNASYPLLTILDGKNVKQINKFSNSIEAEKQVEIIKTNLNDQEIITKVEAEISDGGIAGIIVNSVKHSQKLAKLVPEDIPVVLLHSSFLAPDREKIEEKVQQVIGKNASRPKKMIVIGTQILEQSLDIDFDILFTEIAPMDLLIQRIGRLHRHNISRPSKLCNPKVFITGIQEMGRYDESSEYIYGKYLLMKTDCFIPDVISIPYDISCLVQNVYDDNNKDLHLSDKLRDVLDDAYIEFENKKKTAAKKAAVFQVGLPFSGKIKSIFGWLDSSQINTEDENHAAACVRDIKETIEVVLLKNSEGGDCLLDGRSLKEVSSEEVASQSIRLPYAIVPNVERKIKELEKETQQNFPDWGNNIWLRGVLAMKLDKFNCRKEENYTLHYSSEFGLEYEKEDENES